MAHQLQELLIVTAHRSGSNHLANSMRSFQRVAALREVFNPTGIRGVNNNRYMMRALGRKVGQHAVRENNLQLLEHFTDRVAAIGELAEIARNHNERLLSYKLLLDQLPFDQVERLLTERRPAVLFLVRNRLESYVSYAKADKRGEWAHVDTTSQRDELAMSEFEARSANVDRWFADTTALVDRLGLRSVTLGYGRDINGAPARTVQTLRRALLTVGIRVQEKRDLPNLQYKRQDRTPDVFARFSNGASFRDELKRRALLDYALTAPLADRVVPRWRLLRAEIVAFLRRRARFLTNR